MAQFWYDSRTDFSWESLPTRGWFFPCAVCNIVTGKNCQLTYGHRCLKVYVCNTCQRATDSEKLRDFIDRRYIRSHAST